METDALELSQATRGLPLALAYLATGLWISATASAWLLGLRAVASALSGHGRRLVHALRWGTWTASVDLFGLVVMVAVANPVRYRTGGWLFSLAPLALAVAAVMLGTRAEPAADA